ncbi:hypothetical protein [Sporolituus thermophilus]|uniref:Uncharacterized protein n=1 Tax=Sporolituus thermophilus DSM 23256 TaxID=1123285 RepID=A0A1G7MK23_9FIRM|nr:hypothetical protein [Sporolituus thermophilus]SDF61460.1 hypothetical protein SAMN05660235_02179 [Sporolituus thermophilus DSM 23256]
MEKVEMEKVKKYGADIESIEYGDQKNIIKVYDDDDFFSFVFYDAEKNKWYSDDSVGSIPSPANSFEEAVMDAMGWLELVHDAVAENQTQSKRAIKKRMLESLADWMVINGRIRKPFREKFNKILLNG